MISYITVNYNNKQDTLNLIESIENKNNKNEFEIIVVDNNSTDGSKNIFEELENDKIFLNYIYCDNNHGFGKANNIGFKKAKGEYIYIINNDVLLHTNNIEAIIKEKFKNNIGVITNKVIYEDGSSQTNVQNFSNLKTVFLRLLKVGQYIRNNDSLLNFLMWVPIKPDFIRTYLNNFNKENKEELIQWASGCSLIFKREVYTNLEGFDENFFMYTEDEEICYRVHKLGYTILYTPDILITHFEGNSNSNNRINEFLTKTKVQSEFYYYEKHFIGKLKKLKTIYWLVSIFGYLFSKRLRIIHKTIRELK